MRKHKRATAAQLLCGDPAEPIPLFSYGVLFEPDPEEDALLLAPSVETLVFPDSGSAADLWFIEPDGFAENPELTIVMVDARRLRSDTFKDWLHGYLRRDGEDPPLRLYVPEAAKARRDGATLAKHALDAAGVHGEVVSYLPPRVW